MAQLLKCSTAKMAVVQVRDVKEAVSAITDILFHYAEWYANYFGVNFEAFCESVWEKFSNPDAEGEECPEEELQRTGKLMQFSAEPLRLRVMQAGDKSTNLHIKISVNSDNPDFDAREWIPEIIRLWLSTDYGRKEWVYKQCERLFKLFNTRLAGIAEPVEFGINGVCPVVFFEIEGTSGLHKMYEFDHRNIGGELKFESSIDLTPYGLQCEKMGIIGDSFKLLI